MVSTAPKPLDAQRRRSSDPVSWYLATIGRIPLLTPAEEIELGNQVQAMMQLTEDGSRTLDDSELTLTSTASPLLNSRGATPGR